MAADLGDWHRAATLHGIAQAFADRSGGPWQDLEAHYRQESLAAIRAQLGEEETDRTYVKGSALSTDEAFRFALGPPAPASPAAAASDTFLSTASGVGDPGPDLVGPAARPATRPVSCDHQASDTEQGVRSRIGTNVTPDRGSMIMKLSVGSLTG